MGHGLQMWLQTMWFLARSKDDSTIILDEPDVYLHADLQRKLIRLLVQQKRQVIVTTHSVEMMAEVEAENILIIERRKTVSNFAASLPAVQRIISHIGSAHNIHLARLWNARRCLLVEGKDIKLLKIFQNIMFPETMEPLDIIPNMPIGGWGGWNYAIGSSMLIKNSIGQKISVYCVLDRDYHTPQEITQRYSEANKRDVQLHIWNKKEIENYVLIPEVICRFIALKAAKRTTTPNTNEIVEQLDRIADYFKDDVFDALSSAFFTSDKAKGASGANKEARKILNEKWTTFEEKIALISGKSVISRLSEWSQQEFGVGFNAQQLAMNMKRTEIPEEISRVITSIENDTPFII